MAYFKHIAITNKWPILNILQLQNAYFVLVLSADIFDFYI